MFGTQRNRGRREGFNCLFAGLLCMLANEGEGGFVWHAEEQRPQREIDWAFVRLLCALAW